MKGFIRGFLLAALIALGIYENNRISKVEKQLDNVIDYISRLAGH